MRVLSVVGARPQFVKAAMVSAELKRRGMAEFMVHSGQHYDYQMSQVFFDQLTLPAPAAFLNVGSGSHAAQTAEIMRRLELVLLDQRPDWVVVYGDTNTTVAGALVASKLRMPLAHVEAGLRSFNKSMPEEINRIITDHVSDMLLAPHASAASQLYHEGILGGVHVVGDLMVDSVMQLIGNSRNPTSVMERFKIKAGEYVVATVHRASNTDDPHAFSRIIQGLRKIPMPVLFPVHPRTAALGVSQSLGRNADNILPCEPLPYADMLELQRHARAIVTDSGGMQKEALVLRVPCVTLRDETEWSETLVDGWNVLVGSDPDAIAAMAQRNAPSRPPQRYYGDGHTAQQIVDLLTAPSAAAQPISEQSTRRTTAV